MQGEPVDPLEYWSRQPGTLAGVLGNLPALHELDIQDSALFLRKVEDRTSKLSIRFGCPAKLQFRRVADIGGGIGRVAQALLIRKYSCLDLYEPVPHLLEEAKRHLREFGSRIKYYQQRAQEFGPSESVYDLIWIQWTGMYLDDKDLECTLRRCLSALTPEGIIIVKENVAEDSDEFDEEDSSRARCLGTYLAIFEAAGAELFMGEKSSKYPKSLYDVYRFCLRRANLHPLESGEADGGQ